MTTKTASSTQEASSRAATGYPTPPYIAAMLTALILAPFVGVFLALVELFYAPVKWLKWADAEARKSHNVGGERGDESQPSDGL